jgi:restriction system protein
MLKFIQDLIRFIFTRKKGGKAEVATAILARFHLGNTYRVHEHVTLPTPDGTTQIDLLILSRYGIFVIEVKDYKGWIFGGEKQAKWTHVRFRKKYKFQNPLHQNYKHTQAVQNCLGLDESLVFPVVNFNNAGQFKTPMPPEVTRGPDFTDHIKTFTDVLLTEEQVLEIETLLESTMLERSRETDRQHIANVNAIRDNVRSTKCPSCGGQMVQRTARKGKNAGNTFWGCSNFPQCRFTRG